MTIISSFSVVLGWLNSSTKIHVMAFGSKWFNRESSSTFVFFSLGICVNYIYENSPYSCLTSPLYFLSRGSFTSYSLVTCRTTNRESTNTINFSTLIFLASHKPASKTSYSIALLVMRNMNLTKYLNSSLLDPINRMLAPAPSYADDPSTYTNQTFDYCLVVFWQPLLSAICCCPWSIF